MLDQDGLNTPTASPPQIVDEMTWLGCIKQKQRYEARVRPACGRDRIAGSNCTSPWPSNLSHMDSIGMSPVHT